MANKNIRFAGFISGFGGGSFLTFILTDASRLYGSLFIGLCFGALLYELNKQDVNVSGDEQ